MAEIIIDSRGTTKEVASLPPKPQETQAILDQKEPFKPEDIARELEVGAGVVTQMIEALQEEGYSFIKEGEYVVRSKDKKDGDVFDASKLLDPMYLRFGVISDTHLSSKKERTEELEAIYDTFQSEGIHMVFHVGDVSDGVKIYRGQELEQLHFGQEEQIGYAVKTYPKREGVNTFAISGNHDLREYERGGVDPLVQIVSHRKDIKYLGQMSAEVKLAEGVKLELVHPDGGSAYALSYKAQRDINNRSPGELPDILCYGHFHTSFYMHYRGIHFLQTPCFKGQGNWEKRKGLNPTIGGWLVEGQIVGDRISQFKPELFTF